MEVDVPQRHLQDPSLAFIAAGRRTLGTVELEVELRSDLVGSEMPQPLKIAVDLDRDRSENEVGRGPWMRHGAMITRLRELTLGINRSGYQASQ